MAKASQVSTTGGAATSSDDALQVNAVTLNSFYWLGLGLLFQALFYLSQVLEPYLGL